MLHMIPTQLSTLKQLVRKVQCEACHLLHNLLNEHRQEVCQHLPMPVQRWTGVHLYQVDLQQSEKHDVQNIAMFRHVHSYKPLWLPSGSLQQRRGAKTNLASKSASGCCHRFDTPACIAKHNCFRLMTCSMYQRLKLLIAKHVWPGRLSNCRLIINH